MAAPNPWNYQQIRMSLSSGMAERLVRTSQAQPHPSHKPRKRSDRTYEGRLSVCAKDRSRGPTGRPLEWSRRWARFYPTTRCLDVVLLGPRLGAARAWGCAESLEHVVRRAVFLDDEDDVLEGGDLGRGRRRQTKRRQRQRKQMVHDIILVTT